MDSLNQKRPEDRPITVLHIAPTPFFSDRGCHMRIRGIIQAMSRRAVTSVLVTYNLGHDVEGIKAVRIATIPGYTKLEAGPTTFKYLADIFLLFKVIGQISSQKPDIIHTHLHEGALLGWAARLFFFWRKTPLIFDMQGSLVGELAAHGYFDKSGFVKKIFHFVEYLIVHMPDRIICSSENSVDILQGDFNINTDSLSLINDGVDNFNITEAETLKSALALPVDKKIIIYTGALLASKGLNRLCDTILEANKRDLKCHFLIVGYPEKALQEFCAKNKLQDRCTIAGRVPYDDLGNYLALADIAIEPKLSSSGEASGKLLNYMGAGLPVICFDTASNRQILGSLGYYSPVNDRVIADQLEAVLAAPEKAVEVGIAAKKRAHDEFSWDKAGEKIQGVYQSCLKQKNKP